MRHPKRGIRWLVFKLFGPPDLKNLVKYIDEISDNDYDIAIYPMGEFPFAVKTSNEDDLEPIMFPTPQERAAFQHGLNYGVQVMGGTTSLLSKDDYDEINKMEKLSTHSDKKTRLN
ncbi:hypothetical protein PP753_gp65 [Dinoroseobacter phage vB_DshP-R7L]|uniref:Uncharacterized protein n=1 Tax=Dinoroseobacter phage vB_DshP-R7L TaxID=2873349 RepID=A0AAE8XFL1_9CAUD|nr:hypothetical protein PP753_gp65 [Dinoroseobacter phage vB_DshP-R7L]UAT28893.1 hypothetical protein R7L_gp54 [Dinoroseobacter phage vB_DshP-R7L]